MGKIGSAVWKGDFRNGNGSVSTQSGALNAHPYSFNTRYEDIPGANPEELIGAAQAACFSMALARELGQRNLSAREIHTDSAVTLKKQDGGFIISAVHLNVEAHVPGASEEAFLEAADVAKATCPIAQLINAKTTMVARLLD
jgi:osmotically inducible protein OsmC